MHTHLSDYANSSLRQKDARALRTIGEASEILELPQHVLRFWETKFKQIKPIKRRGGHRYYRPEDIDALRRIKHLLHGEGHSIKVAQEVLRQQPTHAITLNGVQLVRRNTMPADARQQDLFEAEKPVKQNSVPVNKEKAQQLQRVLEELDEMRATLKQAK